MIKTLKNKIITVKDEDVLEEAQSKGLDVSSIEDFREYSNHYNRIEKVMDDYRSSFARFGILSGLTTGIGGFTTSITFASLDTLSLALQLYRLAQKYAILNGFDNSDPLHKDKMLTIYFEALGINAATQATVKHLLLKASAKSEAENPDESLMLKGITRSAQVFGKHLSADEAGTWVPVVGGVIGASINYSFAQRASSSMKKAFKRAYFDEWVS